MVELLILMEKLSQLAIYKEMERLQVVYQGLYC